MQFWSLFGPNRGPVSYEEVRQLQLKLVEFRAQDRCVDTFLFLEHLPVITRGRGLQYTGVERARHMPFRVHEQDPRFVGVEFAESERGGDLTYHGPGQWVIYPICKLGGEGFAPEKDIEKFLRKLEQLLIDELSQRGLVAGRKEHASGVWMQDRKLASVGIAVKKWVTYHGIALNCVNDLAPFSLISPCGFESSVMTRLCDWVSLSPDWRMDLERSWAQRIAPGAEVLELSLGEANAKIALQ